jgi:hypothetical protein
MIILRLKKRGHQVSTTKIGKGGIARVERARNGKFEVVFIQEFDTETEATIAAQAYARGDMLGVDGALSEVRLGAALIAESCARGDLEVSNLQLAGLNEYVVEVLAKAGCVVARKALESRLVVQEALGLPPLPSLPPRAA